MSDDKDETSTGQVSEVQTLGGQDDDSEDGHVAGEGGLGDGGFADSVPGGTGAGDVGAADDDSTEGRHPEDDDEG